MFYGTGIWLRRNIVDWSDSEGARPCCVCTVLFVCCAGFLLLLLLGEKISKPL